MKLEECVRPSLGAVFSLAIVLGAACAPPPTASTGSQSTGAVATPGPSGPQILNYGTHQFPATMDTRVAVTGSARRNDVYETLVVQDQTGKIVQPLLAKSWDMKDPMTWEFEIVTDRKFHDGTPMTV